MVDRSKLLTTIVLLDMFFQAKSYLHFALVFVCQNRYSNAMLLLLAIKDIYLGFAMYYDRK